MTNENPPSYMHGYGSASRHMATRRAENFADFFIPNLTSGMRVLDVGCGPGSITVGLAQLVPDGNAIGIDIADSEVEKAKALAEREAVRNVEFLQASGEDLPFEDDSFDAVFSCAMLEHVQHKEKALNEITRVLKPRGLVGLVGGAFEGHMIGPSRPETPRMWEIFYGLMGATYMDGDFGLKQTSRLRSLGYTDLVQMAWYWNGSRGERHSDRFREEGTVEQAEKLGISTRDEMEGLAKVIDAIRDDPDYYSYFAWIKTLGLAPAH